MKCWILPRLSSSPWKNTRLPSNLKNALIIKFTYVNSHNVLQSSTAKELFKLLVQFCSKTQIRSFFSRDFDHTLLWCMQCVTGNRKSAFLVSKRLVDIVDVHLNILCEIENLGTRTYYLMSMGFVWYLHDLQLNFWSNSVSWWPLYWRSKWRYL